MNANRLFPALCRFLIILALFTAQDDLWAQRKKDKDKQKKEDAVADAGGDPELKAQIDYLFLEANTVYLRGRSDEAIALFRQVLELDPEHHASMYNIARISAETGDMQMAIRYGKDALKFDSGNYWYYHVLRHAYEAVRRFSEAIELQEEVVHRFPDNPEAYDDLARLYMAEGRMEDAVATYDKLEQAKGPDPDIIFRKHKIYIGLGRLDKASEEVDKLLDAEPGNPEFLQAKYDLLMMQDRKPEALALLERLVEFNPGDGLALISLADYYQKTGDHERSYTYVERAFRNSDLPLEGKVQILATLYDAAAYNEELRLRLKTLLDLVNASEAPSALLYGINGDYFMLTGESDSARYYYHESVMVDPANQEAWEELLYLDAEIGNFEYMRKDAEEAREYFPNQSIFLYFLGLAAKETGDYEEARYAFGKVRKFGTDRQGLLGMTLIGLAEIEYEEKNYTESEKLFDEALKAEPGDPTLLNEFAWFLCQRNEKLSDAEKYAKQALDIQPENPVFIDTYGWVLYKRGRYADAVKELEKATARSRNPIIHEHYGDALYRSGDKEGAKKAWEMSISLGNTNLNIEEKLKTHP